MINWRLMCSSLSTLRKGNLIRLRRDSDPVFIAPPRSTPVITSAFYTVFMDGFLNLTNAFPVVMIPSCP